MKRSIWIIGFAVLLHTLPSLGQSVVRDGKEWLQPVDFTSLSWNDVNAVCPAGVCAGTLNGIDVTGYTWATLDEVNELMNSYGVVPPLGPGPTGRQELDSLWAPAILAAFSRTQTSSTSDVLRGWTMTPGVIPGSSETMNVFYITDPGTTNDTADSIPFSNTTAAASIGAFLYMAIAPNPIRTKDPSAIPTIPTYGLIFTVIGLLAIATRRLVRRKAKEG